jgi:adenine-specific DNA-methyltransferase
MALNLSSKRDYKNRGSVGQSLLDKILAAKKSDSNADISALEKQIDELVYKLYNLNEEEIAIIEGKIY